MPEPLRGRHVSRRASCRCRTLHWDLFQRLKTIVTPSPSVTTTKAPASMVARPGSGRSILAGAVNWSADQLETRLSIGNLHHKTRRHRGLGLVRKDDGVGEHRGSGDEVTSAKKSPLGTQRRRSRKSCEYESEPATNLLLWLRASQVTPPGAKLRRSPLPPVCPRDARRKSCGGRGRGMGATN